MEFTNEKDSKVRKASPAMKFMRNFILIAITLVILLCGLGVWLYNWAAEAIIHNKPEVIVPDITGKSSVYALETLSKVKLSVNIEKYEFKESEPIGTVIKQLPEAGTTVREGKTIRITVSQGGETVFTPTLTGMSLRNAELLLRQSQLSLGEISTGYSMKVEKGTVLSQSPKPETSVAKNTMVNVKVSDGAPPSGILMMPDFRQKDRETVRLWAEKNDVNVDYREDDKSTFARDTVIDQSPEPDTLLDGKAKVRVTVSTKQGETTAEGGYAIKYEVPSTGSERNIRIVSLGKNGEREVFNGTRSPGTTINFTIPKKDISKVRIFVNGIQVEERIVK